MSQIPINPDLKSFAPNWANPEYINLRDLDLENGETSAIVKVKMVLCNNCEGKGSHIKTSLRSIAISSDDEDYDPDFMDDMMAGHFDQSCQRCNGFGRVYDIDWEYCPEEVKDSIQAIAEADREMRLEIESERRFCGGY